MTIARDRLSPSLMAKIFSYKSKAPGSKSPEAEVIFQRSELFFNEKPSIMINIRTLEQE